VFTLLPINSFTLATVKILRLRCFLTAQYNWSYGRCSDMSERKFIITTPTSVTRVTLLCRYGWIIYDAMERRGTSPTVNTVHGEDTTVLTAKTLPSHAIVSSFCAHYQWRSHGWNKMKWNKMKVQWLKVRSKTDQEPA